MRQEQVDVGRVDVEPDQVAAEATTEPAQRPARADLERVWRERSTRFRTGGAQLVVVVRVLRARRDELAGTALAVRAEEPDADGWLRLEVAFQDARHAEWALWQLGPDAEALAPRSVRRALHEHAAAVAVRHADPSP